MATVTIDGTGGDDFIYVSLLPDYTSNDFIINGGNGADTIRSGPLDDLIRGGKGADRIYAGAGDDYVQAGNQDDYVDGGYGNDILSGGAGNDTLKGGKGNDTLLGGNDNDFLYGVKGYNTLDGGNGDDFIDTGVHSSTASGGAGSDTLVANMSKSGRHTLNGGADDDTFVFGSANAKKRAIITVEDFEIGVDTFVVGDVSDVDFMASLLTGGPGSIAQDGADVVLTLGTRDTIIFEGVDESDFIDFYDVFAIG